MIPRSELIPRSEYVRTLRPLLPPEAFRPSPRKLWQVAFHLGVMAAGVAAVRFSASPWFYGFASLVIGHSSACVGFLTHDLGHGSVVRGRRRKRALETVLWAVNMVPATFWLRVHMQAHHSATNTLADPDRKLLAREQTQAAHRYVQAVMPCSSTPRWLPTVFVSFPTYVARYTAYAFARAGVHIPTTTTKLRYFPGDRRRVLIETVIILALQGTLLSAVGGDVVKYLFVGPLAIGAASSVVMMYIFTNHLLNPHVEIADPLIATTSVVVPAWFNRLHSNFSFHTEHHVFPGIDSDHYPRVAELLQHHWPQRYHQLHLAEAWRRLWDADEFIGPDFARTEDDPGRALDRWGEPDSGIDQLVHDDLANESWTPARRAVEDQGPASREQFAR